VDSKRVKPTTDKTNVTGRGVKRSLLESCVKSQNRKGFKYAKNNGYGSKVETRRRVKRAKKERSQGQFEHSQTGGD